MKFTHQSPHGPPVTLKFHGPGSCIEYQQNFYFVTNISDDGCMQCVNLGNGCYRMIGETELVYTLTAEFIYSRT